MTYRSTEVQKVPLCDLGALHEPLLDELQQAMGDVLLSQRFINGPQVAELEGAIGEYCGTTHALGCSSGTDALLLALMALEIGPGDEVITTPYTFFATVGAIARLGARPVFVDIEPDTFNIDATQIEAAISPRTKAIIPVHLFGQTADMDTIVDIASRRGLPVIEDAAQAIGAEYQGQRAGSRGTLGCFSFFPSKNLGCLGDGGMVVTNDGALAEKIGVLRNHGAREKYHHGSIGGNFRLDTLQAAVLSVKLPFLDHWNSARRIRAEQYQRLLAEELGTELLVAPVVRANRLHVFNQFVVRCRADRRDGLRSHLTSRGITTAIYYPAGLHLQPCFGHLGYRTGDFPECERACHETLALPMHPHLGTDEIERVVKTIREYICGAV